MQRIAVLVIACIAPWLGAQDGALHLRPLGSVEAIGGDIRAVDFSHDGRIWCTGGGHGDLVVWDGPARRLRARWETGAASVYGLRVHPAGTHALVSVYATLESSRLELRLFDLRDGAWRSLGSTLGAIAWSRDASRLAWVRSDPKKREGSSGVQLCVHELAYDEQKLRLGAMRSVAVPSGYGSRLVSSAKGDEYWIEARGYPREAAHVHVALVGPRAQVREKSGLVLGLDEGAMPIRASETSCSVGGRVYSALASERPRWFVSRDRGQILMRSRRSSGNVFVADAGSPLRGHPLGIEYGVVETRFAPGGALVVLDAEGQMHVLRFRDGGLQSHEILSEHRGRVNRVLWSSDGSQVAVRANGAVVFADRKARVRHKIAGRALIARGDAGSEFVRIGRNRVQRIDVATNRQIAAWPLPAYAKPPIWRESLAHGLGLGSSRLTTFAVATQDARSVFLSTMRYTGGAQSSPALVWQGGIDATDYPSAEGSCSLIECFQLARYARPGPAPRFVAALLAPPPMMCGNGLMGYEFYGALCVFDEERRLLSSHAFAQSPRALAISPDGQTIAVAASKGIRLFSRKTGSEGFEQGELHDTAVADWLGFVDDKRLLTLSEKTLHLWRLPSLKHVASLPIPISFAGKNVMGRGLDIRALDISPSGDALAIGVDTRAHLFALKTTR